MEVLFIKAWVDVSVEALPDEARVVVGMEVVPNETREWRDLAQGGLINVGNKIKPDEPLSDRSCRYIQSLSISIQIEDGRVSETRVEVSAGCNP